MRMEYLSDSLISLRWLQFFVLVMVFALKEMELDDWLARLKDVQVDATSAVIRKWTRLL